MPLGSTGSAICPPTGSGVKFAADDLFHAPLDQAQIDFQNEGGETYICGNPPYYGSRKQEEEQKADLKVLCANFIDKWKSPDYVAGWILLARKYAEYATADFAFVSTSSLCEGLQVSVLWPHIIKGEVEIKFAYRPFSWRNLAANNAGVTVVIVGVSNRMASPKRLFIEESQSWTVDNITPYLTPGKTVFVDFLRSQFLACREWLWGACPAMVGT